MANWYYNIDGKMFGPCEQKQIQELIYIGRLEAKDIVLREGDEEWAQLKTFPEFDLRKRGDTEGVEDEVLPPPQKEAKPGDWLVLKKIRSESGFGFSEQGPLTSSLLRKAVKKGDFEYTDFAWTPGMGGWQALGKLPEFDRRNRRSFLNIKSGLVLVAFVALAMGYLAQQPSADNKGENKSKPKPPVVAKERAPKKKIVRSKKEAKKIARKPPQQAAKRKSAKKKAAPMVPKLSVSADRELLKKGLVAFNSNNATGRRVHIEVQGEAGQILAFGSFQKRFEFKRSKDLTVVDFFKRGVPQGLVSVKARAGSLTVKKKLFLGDPRGFKKRLGRRLKANSFYIQKERSELLYQLGHHRKMLSQLSRLGKVNVTWRKNWNGSVKGRLKSFKRVTQNNYFFPYFWQELSQIRSLVRSDVLSHKSAIQTSALRTAYSRMDRLHKKVRRHSLWNGSSASPL